VRFDFEAMEEDSDKEEDGDYTPDNRNYNPYLAFDNLSVEGSDAESSFGIVDGSDAGSDGYVSGDDSDFDPDYDNEALEQFIEDEFLNAMSCQMLTLTFRWATFPMLTTLTTSSTSMTTLPSRRRRIASSSVEVITLVRVIDIE